MSFESTARKTVFVLDQNHEILLRLRGAKFKSYADYFIPPLLFARQHVGNLLGNARLFLARDFHMDAGMKCLVESFYRSIREGAPVPIPYREILLTARIMDAIFDQLRDQLPNRLAAARSRADLAFQAQPLVSKMAGSAMQP